MFCPECGTQVLEEAAFCQKCGAKLIDNDTASQEIETSDRQASAAVEDAQSMPPNAAKAGKLQKLAGYGKALTWIGLAIMFLSSFIHIPISPIILFLGVILGIFLSAFDAKRSLFSRIMEVVIAGIVLVVGVVILLGSGKGNDKYIQMVKDGTLEAYSQKTVGEAFDGYLGNPKWESGVSEDGKRFVNVTGKILYYDKETDILVQFFIENDESGSFSYNACELNGVPQNNFFFWGLLESVYNGDELSSAENSAENSSDYVSGENSIMIGETKSISVDAGEMEVTLDSIEFTDGPISFGYNNLTPDDGFTYLVASLTVKNTGTTETGLNTLGSTVIYDGKYEYTMEHEIGESILNLAPLSNPKTAAIIFMVPKSAAESEEALVINIPIGFRGDNISYTIRAGRNDEYDTGMQTPEYANDNLFDSRVLAGEYEGEDVMPPSYMTINIYSSPEDDILGDYSITIPNSGIEYTGELCWESDKTFSLISNGEICATIEVIDETFGSVVIHYSENDFECNYRMYEAYPMP